MDYNFYVRKEWNMNTLFTIYDSLKSLNWQTSKEYVVGDEHVEFMSYHENDIHVSIQAVYTEVNYDLLSLMLSVELPLGTNTILSLDARDPISVDRIISTMQRLPSFIPQYQPKQVIELHNYHDDSLYD